MVTMSSATDVLAALGNAGDVCVLAYTLRRGPVLDALEAAAHRGAHVRVRLEGRPYDDKSGGLERWNARIVSELRRAGADAQLAGHDDAPVHAKAIVADAALFLDDRNWGAKDFIVRDDDAADANDVIAATTGAPVGALRDSFAMQKRGALHSEGQLLRGALAGDDTIAESESFGCCNAAYDALDALGRAGAAPRLLVAARDLRRNHRERSALERLRADGVRVRVCQDSEKFALAGNRAWIGSANATAPFATPDTIDWGLRTDDPTIVASARERVEEQWKRAKAL
jgi:phosphatidylserine/phosphatidylglycerophosphate/cardiolipin synthase-like enzyme